MRGGGARRAARRDRLRRRADARPAAGRDGRHGAERARPLRRGALRRGAQTRRATEQALAGAALIARWLPRVSSTRRRPRGTDAAAAGRGRTQARRSGSPGSALAHAMAQALGGRYGLPHGAMNALCLPPALRFNARVVPEASRASARRSATRTPAARVEELARLGGFERLRDFGVPERRPRRRSPRPRRRGGATGEPASGDAGRRSRSCSRSIW